MGGVISLVLLALVVAGVVMSSVALYRIDHPATTTGDVTLDGSQVLSNKTLISPVVTRLMSSGLPPQSVVRTGFNIITEPTLSTTSSDMAGTIVANGTGISPGSSDTMTITLTFSVPYAVRPTAVLVNALFSRIIQLGPGQLTWDENGFVMFWEFIDTIPVQPNPIDFWSYIVVA